MSYQITGLQSKVIARFDPGTQSPSRKALTAQDRNDG
jgi:hypothetical protein